MARHAAFVCILSSVLSLCVSDVALCSEGAGVQPIAEWSLGQPVKQLRAVPVRVDAGEPECILVAYCADFDCDPYVEMFFFPSDSLKLALYRTDGTLVWRKDLGPGVVPGLWFCPVFAFDLEGNGADEIYYVGNIDPEHPLSHRGRRLIALDAATGETAGQWPWPAPNASEKLSYAFRNFLLGGVAGGEPVLVTAQGTYTTMTLQGWSAGMKPRWSITIPHDAPGARGSHMCPIVDLDGDGDQEVMWGERCIELTDGRERFCADRDSYRGHSDVIAPFIDRDNRSWMIFTCRESDTKTSPRVAAFDAAGARLWGDLDRGHIDIGWVAMIGDEGRPVASAIRIGGKSLDRQGRYHRGVEEFAYDAVSGRPVKLPFATYRTVPVDMDGDGCHELVCPSAEGMAAVIDRTGRALAELGEGADVAIACKLLDRPGEQLLMFQPDGTVRIWADMAAVDSERARARYTHPFYRANRRMAASGYNLKILGGI
ncbi:MAG: polysaccharide lyase 11 [Planctomycetota bacterium]